MKMKIYDRYGGRSAQAQADRRAALLKIWLKAAGYILAWLALLGMAHLLESEGAFRKILILGGLCVFVLILEECVRPLRENDLFTFGYDGHNLALMGIGGKPRTIISPEELNCIRIDEASRPFRRHKQSLRYFGRISVFERYGERRKIQGKKRFVAEPMVLPEPRIRCGKDYPGWLKRTIVDPDGEFLCWNVGFVPKGENKQVFVRLLQDTRCPVVIRRDFYHLHRRLLDGLFEQSGMDMGRLVLEGKERE